MKLTKLILVLFLACSLQLAACSLVFSAGEDITVAGDTKAQTVSLDNAALPASGSEGEIRYDNATDKLYVWDGNGWKLLSANKNVATRIVAASNSLDTVLVSGVYTNPRADYICDGTDDQEQINQAIIDIVYSASGKAKGGVVYLLDGTYNISNKTSVGGLTYKNPVDGSSITINTAGIVINPTAVAQSGISLIGAGAGTVLAPSAYADYNAINATNVTRIHISQLMISGGLVGINCEFVTLSKIDNVWIDVSSVNEYSIAILFKSSEYNIVSNNSCLGKEIGIAFTSSNNSIISGNSCNTNQYFDISLDSSSNNIISGNHCSAPRGPAVSTGTGIGINNSSNNNIISGNDIMFHSRFFTDPGYTGGIGIGIFSSSSGNTVSGNNIQENDYKGISLESSSNNNVISANLLNSNGKKIDNNCASINVEASNNNDITGNLINDDGNFGIFVRGNSDNNLISSSYISGSTAASAVNGINISSSVVDNNYLVANYIDGTGFTAKISDSGTGTKYTGKEKITLEPELNSSGNKVISTLSATSQIDPAGKVRSYIAVKSSGGTVTLTSNPPIRSGKAAGDLLILEGTSDTNSITIPTGGVNVRLCAAHSHILGANDTLMLICLAVDDTATAGTDESRWSELSYTNN